MSKTSIEWATDTWNPITGCTRVSPGCDHCYIERTPPFRMAGRKFDKPGIGGTTGVQLHPDRLDQPLHWRKPRLVFVNSLSDLFHDQVPDEFLVRVFDTMANSYRHTFQVLTKRPARMRSFVRRYYAGEFATQPLDVAPLAPSPFPNVWLGVSVEDQPHAQLRIPPLLDTPAAVRFLSCEPLLGPVDLFGNPDAEEPGPAITRTAVRSFSPDYGDQWDWDDQVGIDWVIVGGESGPGARPMHPNWARSLRDQCVTAGVPYLFKQWGEWAPAPSNYGPNVPDRARSHTQLVWASSDDVDGRIMLRRGKHLAGRELDGRTWDQYPGRS